MSDSVKQRTADNPLWYADIFIWQERGARRFIATHPQEQPTVGQSGGPTEEQAYKAVLKEAEYIQKEAERRVDLHHVEGMRLADRAHAELIHVHHKSPREAVGIIAEEMGLPVYEVEGLLNEAAWTRGD